jgi:hypothetical protein
MSNWFGINYIKKLASSDTQFDSIFTKLKIRNNEPLDYAAVEEMKLKREDLLLKTQTICEKLNVLTSIEDLDEINEAATTLDEIEGEINSFSEQISIHTKEINAFVSARNEAIQARDYWKGSKVGIATSFRFQNIVFF